MSEVERNRQIVRALWERLDRKPTVAEMAEALDIALGAERFDDQFAQERGIRLYDATDRTGRPIKVTIPENDND